MIDAIRYDDFKQSLSRADRAARVVRRASVAESLISITGSGLGCTSTISAPGYAA